MDLTAEQLSKATRVPLKSIYYYIERGLMKPKRVNPVTLVSYYDIESVYVLRKIRMLRDVDLDFNQIRKILHGEGDGGVLDEKKSMLRDKIASIERLIAELDGIDDSGRFLDEYSPKIMSIPEHHVCYSKGIVRDRSALPEYIQSVVEEINRANPGLEYTDPKYEFLSYDDDAYVQREVRVNCVQAVASVGTPTKNVSFGTLKGCDVVSVRHRGSYYLLSDASIAALDWMDDNGYRLAGHIRFMGIAESWTTPSESDYLTEVQIPVVPVDSR